MTSHADLRAMLEARPENDKTPIKLVRQWILEAPALVRALLEERDKLVEQLADMRPRAEVYVTAASHNEAMRALEQERDALKAEVERIDDVRTKQIRVLQDIIKNDQTPAGIEVKRLTERAERAEAEVERLRANPAEPISDELRLRCELAARLVPAWVVDQHFDDHNVSNAEVAQVAYNVVGALLAEGRRRMAAEREAKP